MELSEKVATLLQDALIYAQSENYEYVTPEILLLILCEDGEFREAFRRCDGDVRELSADLKAYAEKYLEKTKEPPQFSTGMNYVLTYAGQRQFCDGDQTPCVRHLASGRQLCRVLHGKAGYYRDGSARRADGGGG